MSEHDSRPDAPGLPWRIGSAFVMGMVGFASRSFMLGLNGQKAHGLSAFLRLLDEREDESKRQRGLITVSNHVCVIDDPLVWGVLPYSYHFNPSNHRWSLASYDIVFKNSVYGAFMTIGQTMPTHRLAHSPYGGLFQPTMSEAVRLLSAPKSYPPAPLPPPHIHKPREQDITDPFSSPTANPSPFYYTTNNSDLFYRPTNFISRRHSWIHIFPEGKIHQHPSQTMRYFKWGVARLILEADVCPDIVPIWIEGNEHVMPEDRTFPRFLPRVGKKAGVWFGENARPRFEDYRRQWQVLVERSRQKHRAIVEAGSKGNSGGGVVDTVEGDQQLGTLTDPELMYGAEAVRLREECTLAVRQEVLRVRRQTGLPDEDPKAGLVETYRAEQGQGSGPGEGRMPDGSLVGDA